MSFLNDLKVYYTNEQSYQKVIVWNIAIAVIFFIFKAYYLPGYSFLIDWFSLSANGIQSFYKPWTYVTYAFLHADIFHLLSNLIMLFFACRLFYTYFSNKQFITVYFLGIVFSGILYVLCSLLIGKSSVLVGASAGILAVLFAVVSYNPHTEIQLMLIGRVKLWMVAAVLILFFVIQIPSSNFGGHIAHLAGAFFGWSYTKLLKKGYDLSVIFTNLKLFNSPNNKSKRAKKTPFKKVHYNERVTKIIPSENHLEKQKRIDDILDKISSSGYDSLTTEEKNFLFKAGKD